MRACAFTPGASDYRFPAFQVAIFFIALKALKKQGFRSSRKNILIFFHSPSCQIENNGFIFAL
jgi:hypothetical protein